MKSTAPETALGSMRPAHVTLYEDLDGVAHFAYDRPSTLLAQFGDPDVAVIGKAFDEKLAALGRLLSAGSASY